MNRTMIQYYVCVCARESEQNYYISESIYETGSDNQMAVNE